MDTPVCRFVAQYAAKNALRLHMPGHKGLTNLGPEPLDITEITDADSLYEAGGIIRKSEENASRLFGASTFYATEGSSQCIRAMVYLATLWAKAHGRRPLIAAGRNAHRSFLSALSLCRCDVAWLYPQVAGSYLSCPLTPHALAAYFAAQAELPAAVYVTSPDYLGNMVDLPAIAAVCRQYGVLLLVDNAHGAYLHFLPTPADPISAGADLCCASAHKTLPVLTGGAYLHVSSLVDPFFTAEAKNALAMFGSTSPSYLILQSLDSVNQTLENYPATLAAYLPKVEAFRRDLAALGYILQGREPLKLTIATKPYGYTGIEMAAALAERDIVCEFADQDYLVCMLSPLLGEEGLARCCHALTALPRRAPLLSEPPQVPPPIRVFSAAEAAFMPRECVSAAESEGRILALATVGCPPAVPIVVSGERISRAAVEAFAYYGIQTCTVLKEFS